MGEWVEDDLATWEEQQSVVGDGQMGRVSDLHIDQQENEKLGSDWRFTFGKHKGKRLDDVLKSAPEYIVWCRANIEWFRPEHEIVGKALAEDDMHRIRRAR